jgi:hypothetical protein
LRRLRILWYPTIYIFRWKKNLIKYFFNNDKGYVRKHDLMLRISETFFDHWQKYFRQSLLRIRTSISLSVCSQCMASLYNHFTLATTNVTLCGIFSVWLRNGSALSAVNQREATVYLITVFSAHAPDALWVRMRTRPGSRSKVSLQESPYTQTAGSRLKQQVFNIIMQSVTILSNKL